MAQKKISMRDFFPPEEYQAGRNLVEWGQVSNLTIKHFSDGVITISCTVLDMGCRYSVVASVAKSTLNSHCDCIDFLLHHRCSHLAAALISALDRPKTSRTSGSAKSILEEYRSRSSLTPSSQSGEKVHLFPRLVMDDGEDYPLLRFQVGRDKCYVVKDLHHFLSAVQHGRTEHYGKGLSFFHRMDQFDPKSQKLIEILMDEDEAFTSFHRDYYSYHNRPSHGNPSYTMLKGQGFERLFDLYLGEGIEEYGSNRRYGFLEEDPEVELSFSAQEDVVQVDVFSSTALGFFGNERHLYAVDRGRILRCSQDFLQKVFPLIQESNKDLRFSREDMSAFCSFVLPEVAPYVTTDDPEELLSQYLPDECTPLFYFDAEDEVLSVSLKFRYGDREFTLQDKGDTPQVLRDQRAEQSARELVLSYFTQPSATSSSYQMEGDEAIYTFLTQQMEQFAQVGEVYVSDRLRGMQVEKRPVSVGLSVSDGLLTLDIDAGDFPAQELAALYQSLILRKKYHRLKDGRYLTLDGSSYETLAEVAYMTQLSPKELAAGKVQLPVYRALYLDNVMRGHEDLQVTRNNQFRSLIRQFKTVSDNDYEIPQGQRPILRGYQKTGYRWLKTLESCHFGGILADEMGLGKTLQLITYLASCYPGEQRPSLIVCPASLVLNWMDEFARFAPQLTVRAVLGSAPQRKTLLSLPMEGTILVTSYDLLKRDLEQYQGVTFYCCALDEGQFIKNQSTLASKAVKQLPCIQRFVLTGTPIENRLSELWNLFDFLMPGYLFSHNRFVEKLEKPIVKKGDDLSREQLSKLVQPFILRRLKQDVLKELPPKVEHLHRISLSQEERKVYQATLMAVKGNLGGGKLEILAALMRLRQVCCDPLLCYENYTGPTSKLDACIELCTGLTEGGHQILLFSQFTTMLNRLRSRLQEAGISTFTLQGSTPKEKRAQLVKQFNQGGAQVFLISLKAGGTGLNLTAADVVIHYDPWWNLAAQNQATDRAHRIGQTANVQVYKLIAQDTIEEKIQHLQQKKGALMDVISQDAGEALLRLSQEELMELLEFQA